MSGEEEITGDGGQSIATLISKSGPDRGIDLFDLGIQPDSAEARYQLGKELARGGMGAVLVAKDVSIRREVAMKQMLDPAAAENDEIFRFIEEAQITGQLEHPGIVPVHELGVDESGRVFYTMKRIQGETLQQLLHRIRENDAETVAQWPLPRLLRAFGQVCDAIAFAHSRGVIHRDLKPANIMLGDFGEVLVVDWGIAKLLGKGRPNASTTTPIVRVSSVRSDDTSEALVTMQGSVVGTPNYMAPEQALGDTDGIDQRTDIFALGGILHEILCLQPPITGNSLDEILTKASKATVVDLRELNASRERLEKWPERPHCPKIPASLAAVAKKATEEKKGLRYGCVEEMRRDVDNYLNGFATAAEAAGFSRQLLLFFRRNKSVCIALIGLALVLIVGVGTNLNEQRKRAVDRLKSVPALIQTAKSLMQNGEWEQARTVNTTALDFDSTNPDAIIQQAMLNLQAGNFSAAARDLERAAEESGRPTSKADNIILTKLGKTAGQTANLEESAWPVKDLADQIEALNFPEVALQFRVGRQEKLEAYRKKIAAEWGPSTPANWSLGFTNEQLSLAVAGTNPAFANLKPLAGIPIENFTLRGIATDLSPLQKCTSLRSVELSNPVVTDISPLRNLKLESLIVRVTRARDFSSLSQMSSLRKLEITIERSEDLEPLRDIPLAHLRVECAPAVKSLDLSPLLEMPLVTLRVNANHATEFLIPRPFNRSQLESVSITSGGEKQALDLDFVCGPKVKNLSVTNFHDLKNFGQPESPLLETITIVDPRNTAGGITGLGQNKNLKNLLIRGYSLPVDLFQVPPLAKLEELEIISNRSLAPIPERSDFPALKRLSIDQGTSLINATVLKNLALGQPIEPEVNRLRREFSTLENFAELALNLSYIGSDAWSKRHIVAAGNFQGQPIIRLSQVQLQNWDAAREFARKLGGDLVTITSREKQQWLDENIFSKSKSRTWIGLSRKTARVPFQWVTGEPLTFTNWHLNQPGAAPGTLVAIVRIAESGHLWDSSAPDAVHDLIIEWPAPK